MIRNYLKTAIRHLLSKKSYSLINIGGLSLGICVCILILTYIQYELSYDKFHDNADRIYRVGIDAELSGRFMNFAKTAGPMGPTLKKDYPEIENYTRLLAASTKTLINYQDYKFYEENVYYADSVFFDVFSFKMYRGNPKTALAMPNSIVLTRKLAEKYFKNENPIGKPLRINNEKTYQVTAVVEEVPANSHFQFNALISMSTFAGMPRGNELNMWTRISLYTYILLQENTDHNALQTKFPEFQERHMADLIKMGVKFNLFLQPVTDIHLYSDLLNELGPNGDIKYVYIFVAIALFILLIAGINYMNLASARSFQRAKEVGMRKVHGALKSQIIRQFLSESVLLTIMALAIALLLAKMALPFFNSLIYTDANLEVFKNLFFVLFVIIVLTLIIGFGAGAYPAFYLSSFKPIAVLKGDRLKGNRRSPLRNILVVLQFTIATALIISTSIIYNQLSYMNKKDLGFDKENLMILPLSNPQLISKAELLKSEFSNLSFVEKVAFTSVVPGKQLRGMGYLPEGSTSQTPMMINFANTNDQFVDALKIKMRMGRNFSKEYGMDTATVIINESLQKKLGWDDPIGKHLMEGGRNLKIIGVMQNFHFQSLLDPIEPFLLSYDPDAAQNIILRLNDVNNKNNVAQIRQKWEELIPDNPVEYSFLKQDYEQQYESYWKMGKLFTIFTLIAIFIACTGLFGLASFLTELRTKEIGIRKVNGASIANILRMLNIDFLKWVLIANIIAWPLTYYLMNKWLNNFSYAIDLSWAYFALGTILSILVAMATVSFHSFKAATRNPVDSLKYE